MVSFIHRIFTIYDGVAMVESKSNLFTSLEVELAEICKAMAHPARIKILNILSDMNVCMMGDIADLIPLAQSTVSQHLKELKRVGLIKGEVEGPKICYCINEEKLSKAKKMLTILLNNICKC